MSDDQNPDWHPALEAVPEISPNDDDGDGGGDNVASSETSEAGKRRELLALEKLGSLKHLVQSVDTLIYTELFILYYMDCSFFRLLIRCLSQLILFSPTGPHSTPITVDRPYISGLFVPNIICLFLHAFTPRPEAGEVMRGYLHGGIIMDLIGQKGPTSKIHLLLLDLLILALQCFILAVNTEYKILHFYIKNKEYKNPSTPESVATMTERINQDHDAEERGVFRVAGTTSNDIEMQELSHPENSDEDGEHNTEEDEQRALLGDHLLRDPQSREEELEEWLNLHYAGIAVTAEFHVLQTLRSQYRPYKTRAEMMHALTSGGRARTSRLTRVQDLLARVVESEEEGRG